MKLFSFWRSLATYRVRIALNLKGITPDEVIDVNLMKGAQREAAFRAVNPMMALPALVDGEGPALFESLAIIEYLDETHPNPPLLPRDAKDRARVRGLAQIVACDSHPLIVPRVREYLEHELELDEPTRLAWCRHWRRSIARAHLPRRRAGIPELHAADWRDLERKATAALQPPDRPQHRRLWPHPRLGRWLRAHRPLLPRASSQPGAWR